MLRHLRTVAYRPQRPFTCKRKSALRLLLGLATQSPVLTLVVELRDASFVKSCRSDGEALCGCGNGSSGGTGYRRRPYRCGSSDPGQVGSPEPKGHGK